MCQFLCFCLLGSLCFLPHRYGRVLISCILGIEGLCFVIQNLDFRQSAKDCYVHTCTRMCYERSDTMLGGTLKSTRGLLKTYKVIRTFSDKSQLGLNRMRAIKNCTKQEKIPLGEMKMDSSALRAYAAWSVPVIVVYSCCKRDPVFDLVGMHCLEASRRS